MTAPVKRYTFFAYLDDDVAELDYHESADGGWVGYTDYERLEQECEKLRLDNLSKNGSIKGLGAQIAALQRAVKNRDKLKARAEAERDTLRAQVEALRKDADRYRWMRSSFVRNHKHSLIWYLPMMTPLTAEGLDENIDKAISRK